MKLHEIVNGRQVQLSDEEEAAIKAKWKAEEDAMEEEKKKPKKKSLEERVKAIETMLGI